MSGLAVELDVELRRSDLFRGFLRTIAWYGIGARLLPIVVVLVMLVAIDAAATIARGAPLEEHHLGFGIAFLVVSAVFSLVLHAVSGRVFGSLPSPKARWIIDDAEGARVVAGGREERVPFSGFEGAVRGRHAYYLYTSRTAFRIIPTRGLSEDERATLDQILVRRLPHAPKPPGSRFVTFAAAAGLVVLFLWARGGG